MGLVASCLAGASLLGQGFLDLLYPPHCGICDRWLSRRNPLLCDACWGDIPAVGENRCLVCGQPQGAFVGRVEECEVCRGRIDGVKRIVALGKYDGLLREAILAIKYWNRTAASQPLGELLATEILGEGLAEGINVVIPVPLHRRRYLARGYNQALLLAEPIARRLGKQLQPQAVLRIRDTLPQFQLPGSRRKENLAGAFRISRRGKHAVRNRVVLLVDDLRTTGATLSAVAGVLRKAGAKAVYGAVVGAAG